MPMQTVQLRPGVDVEATPVLNQAGISQSQLIRAKNGLTQTMGGWEQFNATTVPSTAKDLHAWQDTHATNYLGVGARANLVVMTSSSYQDLTPQMRDSTVAPDVSISSGSDVVTIVDVNSGLGLRDTVEFHTPISIGNLLLMGAYPVNTVISTGSYTIISSVVSSTTITSSGILPVFTTVIDSNIVQVNQPNYVVDAIVGLQQTFEHPTTVGGLTIEGPYNVFQLTSSNTYLISTPTAATANAVSTMNGGNAHYHYWITNAPAGTPMGWGGGPYGFGGFGTGAMPSGEAGAPITVTDWTLDNWGEIWLSCEENGPIFQWSPSDGLMNASIIPEAPLKNGGMFVSMPQQILVCWKTAQSQGNGGFNNGGTQDNLIVRWSDAQDFTQWDVSNATAAGSFHIPTGSVIRGGLQAPTYGVIWTDLDVWIMQFIGGTEIFNFTRAGSGCGLIGKHAAGVIAGQVMWAGEQNFFRLGEGGAQVIPCTVWDFFFQQLNQGVDANGIPYKEKICAAPNSAFGEMAWFFPAGNSTENNAYVKVNLDGLWDYGYLGRTAWQDISVVGNPVATDIGTTVWQHEEGNAVNGAGNSSFRTGWWTISDGQDLAFVDWFHPDFIWGQYGHTDASVQLTFYSVDYPGDTPRTYGPFTVTQATEYITPRIRGRLVSMQVTSATNNVFWRLGGCRYRWASAGRR